MITTAEAVVAGGSVGRRFQHQAVWSRNDLPVSPSLSACECFPRSHARNLLSWALRVTSTRFLLDDAPQFGHFQRWLLAAVRPFLTSFVSHSRLRVVFDVFGACKGAGA